MATRSPARVRRSGCCRAASVTGNSNNAAIRRAGMGDLLQGGALTALRAPGAACFTTVLAVGWGEPLKGCGDRAAPQAKVRGAAAWGCQGPRAGGAARSPQLPGLPERANFSTCTNGKSGS